MKSYYETTVDGRKYQFFVRESVVVSFRFFTFTSLMGWSWSPWYSPERTVDGKETAEKLLAAYLSGDAKKHDCIN